MINPHDNPVILLGDEGTFLDSHDFVTVVSSQVGAILYDPNPRISSISFSSIKEESLILQSKPIENKKSKCCRCTIF